MLRFSPMTATLAPLSRSRFLQRHAVSGDVRPVVWDELRSILPERATHRQQLRVPSHHAAEELAHMFACRWFVY